MDGGTPIPLRGRRPDPFARKQAVTPAETPIHRLHALIAELQALKAQVEKVRA